MLIWQKRDNALALLTPIRMETMFKYSLYVTGVIILPLYLTSRP